MVRQEDDRPPRPNQRRYSWTAAADRVPFAVNFHVRFLDVSGALFKPIVRLAFDIAERGMSSLSLLTTKGCSEIVRCFRVAFRQCDKAQSEKA